MLKIGADMVVLMAILYVLLQDQAPDFPHVALVALGMGVANFVCALFLFPLIGYFVLIPIVLIDGLILMYYCSLTLKYAIIALVVLFIYNAAFYALVR